MEREAGRGSRRRGEESKRGKMREVGGGRRII